MPDGTFRAREPAAEQSRRHAAMAPVFGGRVGVAGLPHRQPPRSISCAARAPVAPYRKARCLRRGVHGGVQMCHASCRGWRGPGGSESRGGCAARAPPFSSFLGADSRSPPTACTSSAESRIRAYPGSATTPCANCFNFYLL